MALSFESLPSGLRVLLLAHHADDASFKAAYEAGGGSVTVLLPEEHAKVAELSDGAFGGVAAVTERPFSPRFLEHLMRVLAPGGSLAVAAPAEMEDITRTMLFAGFADVERRERRTRGVEFSAKRPPWALGAAAPLALKSKRAAPSSSSSSAAAVPAPAAPAAPAARAEAPKKGKWSLDAGDLNDEGVPLEDEDALLRRETVKVEVRAPAATDCGPGKGPTRKACKNCSCGAAEAEAKAAPKPKPAGAPVSACGSCGLGDAFRCSTCPYLGQPAFKTEGSAVKLQL